MGPVVFWEDYGHLAAFDAATVQALLRDRRLGRALPEGREKPALPHLADFNRAEAHSMLDLEPPRHTHLRGLVLRAFTSRRIKALRPEIEEVTQSLLASLPRKGDSVDLIPHFCTQLPVRIIARLLGVPEDMSPDLLRWSNAMVAMYQASRSEETAHAANTAAKEFTTFLKGYIDLRRSDPRDDLITHLIAAEQDGEKLSTDALIGTCILLLNAGHESTVHSLGNSVRCLLEHGGDTTAFLSPEAIPQTVEELLRYTPPLHMFNRYAYEDIDLNGIALRKGDEIGLVLGAAGRDPALYENPDAFEPFRASKPHAAFGGGIHFCVGAPLARLEMQIALPALFAHLPDMRLAENPRFANTYHFHKLDRLLVTRG